MHKKRNTALAILIRFVSLLCFIGITYLGLWTIPPRSDLVFASVLDKQALLSSQSAPRLIFVGGSGIALGLDSTLVEAQVKRPVINMGVNAGFGLHYMLNEVQANLQPGDIVIIVPEYEHFFGTFFEGDQNLLWALRLRPESLQQLGWQQLALLVPDLPGFMQNRLHEIIRQRPDPIYNRRAFDAHGDFVNHLKLPPHTLDLYTIQGNQELNQHAIVALQEFIRDTSKHQVTTFLLYPAIAESFWNYRDNQATIRRVQQTIAQSQTIEALSEPVDCVLPDRFFFDTVYHLSEEGRRIRSERIAETVGQILSGTALLRSE